jgi:hypothetical protein
MIKYKNALTTGTVNQGDIRQSFNLYHTSASAQRQCLLNWLIRNGTVNTMLARDRLNIMMPAARIKELRDFGHIITTLQIVINYRDGRPHYQVARYALLELAEVRQ